MFAILEADGAGAIRLAVPLVFPIERVIGVPISPAPV